MTPHPDQARVEELVERLRRTGNNGMPPLGNGCFADLADEAADALSELLSLRASQSAEPVVWQIFTGEEGSGYLFETERWHAEQAIKDGARVTPLYAAPSTSAGEAIEPAGTPAAYLQAILHYTEGFYGSAIKHGMEAGSTANAVAHVERAARALAALAASPSAGEPGKLMEAAAMIVDWRHEWNEHPLAPEAIVAFDALEAALGGWTP